MHQSPTATASFKWMERLLASTLVLNLLDAVLTLLVVTLGLAIEANPIMAAALERGPALFGLLKLGLVSAGVIVLWRHRERPLAAVGCVVVFLAYVGVTLCHVQSVGALAMAASQ